MNCAKSEKETIIMTITMERQLIAAAENGDSLKLREALKDIPKAYIDRSVEEDDTLKTATMKAVWNGHTDVLRILSHHGVNLVEGNDCYSYLEGAARGGHYDTVKYLANEARRYSKASNNDTIKYAVEANINDTVKAAADANYYNIVHYLIKNYNARIGMLTDGQKTIYQSLYGNNYDLQYLALEQACKHLGMDSHIVVIKSQKDCITDADKKAYKVIGKSFAVKRSYLNCNSLDATFFYNNEGKATFTYCGYGNPYDSKDKLFAAFETADKLRMEMDNVLQELVKSEALEEVEQGVDIER